MSYKSSITLILLSLVCVRSLAGITFDGAIGLPSSTITNPDNTKASYSGISGSTRLISPIFDVPAFELTFDLVGKYVDLNNTANGPDQRETGNHVGIGTGLTFRFGKLYLGYDYNKMKARHFFVGNKNEYLEYEYDSSSLFGGLNFSFSNILSVKVTYSKSNADIKSSYTGLSSNSKYLEDIVWIRFNYDTSMSFSKFLSALFK